MVRNEETEVKQEILALVKQYPGITGKEIRITLDLPRTPYGVLRGLIDEGEISREREPAGPYKHYPVADDPQEAQEAVSRIQRKARQEVKGRV